VRTQTHSIPTTYSTSRPMQHMGTDTGTDTDTDTDTGTRRCRCRFTVGKGWLTTRRSPRTSLAGKVAVGHARPRCLSTTHMTPSRSELNSSCMTRRSSPTACTRGELGAVSSAPAAPWRDEECARAGGRCVPVRSVFGVFHMYLRPSWRCMSVGFRCLLF
jgi:hypothetical protein